ncbi:MAG: isoleucine--tRNA ligase [Candidatus Aenigmarchaeota archaeon]|nr:isoleucine--tRNA ligase [Candidatus Aenigmarchaeota archaeon]
MKNYDPKAIEKEVHEFWKNEKIPEKIIRMDWKRKKFYLLDGPPYVNGIPHVGHVKTTTFKDVWSRFKYMQGFAVWFQPGFDCGGLPIENKVEKELRIKSKSEIEDKIGVDKFIQACKNFAKGNEPVWLNLYKKIGAWRGWITPYLTSDDYYIESGWWTIKNWYEQGLLVQGERPGFWCTNCETVLAGIEASESYKNVEDPSILIKFKLKERNEYLLVWTTTPWTLPANVAVIVHPDETYVKVKMGKNFYIIAEKRLVVLDGEDYEVVEKFSGKNLEGLTYEPILDMPSQEKLREDDKAHRIYLSIPIMKKRVTSKAIAKGVGEGNDEFGHIVTMDTGTGLVHTAPGHGDADSKLGRHYNLPDPSPVNERGEFTEDGGELSGIYVKTSDERIIQKLRNENKLFRQERIVHSYPLCWRCKHPLIYRKSRQWFLKMDMLRDKIIKANKKVNWLPEFGRDQYENVISEAPDWAVTRQRYWGIPLPIWNCQKCSSRKVIGSRNEIKSKIDASNISLHKDAVDLIEFKCDCGGRMKRDPDILDVWFDSGIAPWASLGYPYKNKELFEKLWTVDLVDESQDQIRAWFNTMMICGFATFGKAPYKTACMNGWTLDEKGEKMSKSLGNVIDASDAYQELGADLLRLYICYDIAPWNTQKFSMKNAKELGRYLNILWNTYIFYKTYLSNIEKGELEIEDMWILSRLNNLIKNTTQNMEAFNFHSASRDVISFIVDDFSRTYIKLIRNRKDGNTGFVFKHVLETVSKLLAPISPFLSDYIYNEICKNSVHLESWPECDDNYIDQTIENEIRSVDDIVTNVNNVRKEKNIKLRWPIESIELDGEFENRIESIIERMCNVKKVSFKNITNPDFEVNGIKVKVGTGVDEEDALIRELLREIQKCRKEAGLVVTDKINLVLDNTKLKHRADEIKEHVNAGKIEFGKVENPLGTAEALGKKSGFRFERI